jgi:hypothetical protein
MNSIPALSGSLQRTYDTIFQHPVSDNLECRHVNALFRHIAEVQEEPNGNLTNGRRKTMSSRPADDSGHGDPFWR